MSNDKKLKIEMERERQTKALEEYLKTGHAMPKTRREFLASGVKAFGAAVYFPSILQLVTSQAHAQATGCAASVASDMVPFINLNLSGGAALAANCLPLDLAGNMLPHYGKLGMGNPANFSVTSTASLEFGKVRFPTVNDVLISKFVEGIRQTAGTAIEKTAWIQVCCFSQDDSSNNELNISGLVQAAGLQGTLLQNLGTEGTRSGVRQLPAFKSPSSPLVVNSFANIQSGVLPDRIISDLGAARQNKLLKLVKDLSSSQKRQLASSSTSDTLGKLVECATGQNLDLAQSTSLGIDPRQDTRLTGIWDLNGDLTRASLAYVALTGKSGPVSLEMGGYDYHNGQRTQNDDRDRTAGQFVGRVLATAQAVGRPVFMHITTDGSVYSADSQTAGGGWEGDNSSAGMTFVLAFDPNGRPETSGHQIGGFTKGQGADDSFMTRWNASRSALGVFANYLQFSKKSNLFNGLQGSEFDSTQLAKVLKIA